MDDGQTNQDAYTIPDVPVKPSTDRVQPNQVGTGVTRGVQYLGSENVYSDGGNEQIIVATDQPTVLMGNQSTFGKGFYVAKSGIDATTNTDPSNWIFNSNQNTFKVITSYTLTVILPINVASQTQQAIQLHGLSDVPAYLAFIKIDPVFFTLAPGTAGYNPNPLAIYTLPVGTGNLGPILNCTVGIDLTTIYFTVQYGGAVSGNAYTFSAKVYILQETAT